MAHEISRQNFFDNQSTNKPAWHRLSVFEKLGIIREERDYNAKEVYALFGNPQHTLAPIQVVMPDGNIASTEQFMILRHPLNDDPEFRHLGIVSKGYELTDGGFAAGLWDEHIGLPVETMMLLKNDGVLVVTSKMPDYDIKGEGVQNYLIFQNGMNGRISVRADVSATRVVCANTLALAQSYTVNHTVGSIDRIVAWMKDLVERTLFQQEVMKDVYNVLADKPLDSKTVKKIAEAVYLLPKAPNPDFGYANGYAAAVDSWKSQIERVEKFRSDIVTKFDDGGAIGFDDAECQTRGTAWHAMNIFSEFETHRKTSNLDSRAAHLLAGGFRHQMIERATSQIIASIPEAKATMATSMKTYSAKYLGKQKTLT